jgi:hypothetical protein
MQMCNCVDVCGGNQIIIMSTVVLRILFYFLKVGVIQVVVANSDLHCKSHKHTHLHTHLHTPTQKKRNKLKELFTVNLFSKQVRLHTHTV